MAVTSSEEMQMPQQCYTNASRCALLPQYEYVEGYVMIPGIGIPIEHAWIYDIQHKVYLDPTLQNAEENIYFGLKLPTATMLDLMSDTVRYKGSLKDTLCRSEFSREEQQEMRRRIVDVNLTMRENMPGIFLKTIYIEPSEHDPV